MTVFIIASCLVASILISRAVSRRARQKREKQRALEQSYFADLLRRQTADKAADGHQTIEEVRFL